MPAMETASKLSAVCLVATVVGIVLCAFLDPSFQYRGNQSLFRSKNKDELTSSYEYASPVINPISLIYGQQRPLPKRSRSKEDSVAYYSRTTTTTTTTTVSPVQVLLCVEALCIDSQHFFHDQLMIAFNALDHNVMNLTVIPFGNAKLPEKDTTLSLRSHKNITCQVSYYYIMVWLQGAFFLVCFTVILICLIIVTLL